jgi:hypothetical protein
LLGDALELTKQMEFRLLAGVAPFRVEQALGDLKDERRVPDVAEMREIHVGGLADDTGILRRGGADDVRAKYKYGVVVKVGGQPFLGQLHAIAFDAGEADFEGVALGADRFDLNRLARRLRRCNDRLRREVEGNAEDVGVFHIEKPFFVLFVRHATQRPSNDLLTQELGAEGPNAENMGDGIGIPSLGEPLVLEAQQHGEQAFELAVEMDLIAAEPFQLVGVERLAECLLADQGPVRQFLLSGLGR